MTNEPIKQAKGGTARASKLSPERRSEIARQGGLASRKRATDHEASLVAFGSPDRLLQLGNQSIQCYVLEDKRRVITQTGVWSSFGMHRVKLIDFINETYLAPYVSDRLRVLTENHIEFEIRAQTKAYGYDASVLPEMCGAILRARQANAIPDNQKSIAYQAEQLLLGLGTVGIYGLIDEVTGYQEYRDRQALQEVLKAYISGQLYDWTAVFPTEFFEHISRLKGWQWNGGKMPPVVGKYILDIVYSRLAPGVIDRINELNPYKKDVKRRKYRISRLFTPEIGLPELNKRMDELLWLMRGSSNWKDFRAVVDRYFEKQSDSIKMLPNFETSEEEESEKPTLQD
jgi:general stress protein YciG